ncbi:MAG TPA: sialidase family protein [Polyangiaceae bacterium]|jgi:hypothetical protein|nr:sialidase family protein [Polyangiaceae bacterium]
MKPTACCARLSLISAGALPLLLCACSSSSGAPGGLAAVKPVGCAADRPAIALQGGQPIAPQPTGAPVPCITTTGYASVDPTLVVTEGGKVLFAPANVPGFTSSTDQGQTWAKPASPPMAPGGMLYHPWLWHDQVAHRLFYNVFSISQSTCADGSGATLWTSDDEGASWIHAPVGCGSQDWGKVITGPAATAASKAALAQSKYPDMVYYCATGPQAIIGPDHICYRSTDGGKTFVETATHPVSGSDGYPPAGAVGPDGTVYVPKGSAMGLDIATSKDEGDTWTDDIVTGSTFVGTSSRNWLSLNVTADSAGNIYAAWSDDKDLLPYLAVTKDQGATWSVPVSVAAPGVLTSAYPSITVGTPGYVAIAYYGSTTARGSTDGYFSSDGLAYGAYLTVTKNLFDAVPVFWSAQLNDPAIPAFTGLSFDVSEYAGYPVFSPDGTIWTSFLGDKKGFAARLVFP